MMSRYFIIDGILNDFLMEFQIVRIFCYTTKLLSGLYSTRNEDFAKRLAIFSSKMSQTRANLRLFDDIPMLNYSLDYGFGEKEPDRIMALIGTITNLVDTFYYPVDKICWLSG